MLTVKIKTKSAMETWQATKREDGWYVRKNPDIQWEKEPYAHPDASRETVAQLLRKEKDIRY